MSITRLGKKKSRGKLKSFQRHCDMSIKSNQGHLSFFHNAYLPLPNWPEKKQFFFLIDSQLNDQNTLERKKKSSVKGYFCIFTINFLLLQFKLWGNFVFYKIWKIINN